MNPDPFDIIRADIAALRKEIAEVRNERLLNQNDAAAALGIAQETLSRMTTAGKVPCIRIGRSVRYVLAEVIKHGRNRRTYKKKTNRL